MPVTDDEVDRSAAPGAVRNALAQLADAEPDATRLLAGDAGLCRAVVAVIAASRSLSRVVVADGQALEVLGHLDRRPQPSDGDADSLARWKRLELLRIAARDLTGLDDLPTTGRLLADLADDVLGQAHRLAGPRAEGLAVVAMGKAGARELNYASDVDLLFVGEGDARRRIAEVLGDLDGYELSFDEEVVGNASAPEGVLWDAITGFLAREDPGAGVVPTMLPAFTDSRTWRATFPECTAYGFFPQRDMTLYEMWPLVHGKDERIHTSDLGFAARAYHDIAKELLG